MKISRLIFLLIAIYVISLQFSSNPEHQQWIMDGWIDIYTDDTVIGWVCVAQVPQNDLMIEVRQGDELLGYVQRSFPRSDIKARNYDACKNQINLGFQMKYHPRAGDTLNIYIHDMIKQKRYHIKNFHSVKKKIQWKSYNMINPLYTYRISFDLTHHNIRRFHIMMPSFNKDMTGGPLSILRFSLILSKYIKVNLVLTSYGGLTSTELRLHLKKYKGFNEFNHIDISDFQTPILYTQQDLCMATIYHTLYTCDNFLNQIKSDYKPLYFIQDYESIFFPTGSNWIEAENTFTMQFNSVISTKMLSDFLMTKFKNINIANSVHANPAIAMEKITDVSIKKVLFVYARPHSDRNGFDFTMMVLNEALKDGLLDEWTIIGVGSQEGVSDVVLGDKIVKMVSNIPEPEYFKMISDGSMALSLMFSPHPSLPPFDFASRGMIVITNSFWTKTQESFLPISKNILCVEPTIKAILSGLKIGMKMFYDTRSRLEGSNLKWPRSWSDPDCYGTDKLNKIMSWYDIKIE